MSAPKNAKVTKKTKPSEETHGVDTPAVAGEIIKRQEPAANDTPALDPKPSNSGELATSENEALMSIVGGVSTEDLKKALEIQTEQRNLIHDFVNQHLKDGTDYGKIHVVRNCPAESNKPGSCERDYHFSKPILFKPGQEKIFSLFGITDRLEKDVETFEMFPGVAGMAAYKCVMYRGHKRIGEGRGAATLSENQNNANSTIKKAEKRARMDAVLSLGFSAYFTQDLDDPEYHSQREMANSRVAAEAQRRDQDEFGLMPRDPDDFIDNQERVVLHKLLLQNGFSDQDEIFELFRVNGIENPEGMTSGQARDMMKRLKGATFARPEIPEPDPELEPKTKSQDPDIVVDDELKNQVRERAESIGLNTRGHMWLMNKITGRPFNKWQKFTDDEWRRAFTIVQDILDGFIEVDDHHLAGVITDRDDQPSPDGDGVDVPAPDDIPETVQEMFPGAKKVDAKTARRDIDG